MAELKPCPFCGEPPFEEYYDRLIVIGCVDCGYRRGFDGLLSTKPSNVIASPEGARIIEYYHADAHEKAYEAWNRRTKIETNIYDKEETYPNCTVQVLTNTATGEVSVGWWENGGKEDAQL